MELIHNAETSEDVVLDQHDLVLEVLNAPVLASAPEHEGEVFTQEGTFAEIDPEGEAA